MIPSPLSNPFQTQLDHKMGFGYICFKLYCSLQLQYLNAPVGLALRFPPVTLIF